VTEALGNCAGCGRRWNALGQAHCAQCHAHFGSDTAFDLHLGRIPASGPPPCRNPAKLTKRDGTPRLVLRDGVWVKPTADPEWAAKRARADSEPRTAAVGSPMGPGGGESP
jgi:hypothetical protein